MSNSPLVDYIKISPNKTVNRTHIIDTISIHCVVGQLTVEQIGEVFAKTSRKASSNYGIGKDGKIGMYVEEKDRSWCTSSASNDHRAITIEVASDTSHPYAVTDEAYNSLIKLLVDICKRNNIKELKWCGDKNLIGQVDKQNMTVHRWFANKACPGDYLYNRHGDIAKKVNEKLKEPSIPQWTEEDYNTWGKITATSLNIRKEPIADSDAVGSYEVGNVVFLTTKTNNGWYKTNKGYISAKYVEVDYMINDTRDNVPNAWAAEDISLCLSKGFVKGDESGNLRLRDNITREEAFVLMGRMYRKVQEDIMKLI